MFDVLYVIEIFGFLALLTLLLLLAFIYLTGKPANLYLHDSEKHYLDDKGSHQKFSDLKDSPSVDLSVIIPAYNEENRLGGMLDEALSHLEGRKKSRKLFSYELIIVDDGSSDSTSSLGHSYTKKYGADRVRVLTLVKNKGKGGAIRSGMLCARGKILLFADADGATEFSDLDKLETKLGEMQTNKDGMALVCGSRAHLEKESIASRSVFRTFLMYGFHMLVWALCVRGIKDTQCGFKLFTRSAAQLLFYNLHVERWAFDVDLLHIAQTFNVPVAEVAVTWQEIEGSKIVPFWSWLQMGRDLLLIRLRYMIGAWQMTYKIKPE